MTERAVRRISVVLCLATGTIAGWAAVSAVPLAVGLLGALVLLTAPASLLMAAAVIMGHGFTIPSLQAGLVGPLLATDILLLVWLTRTVLRKHHDAATPFARANLLLVGFLGWALLATIYVGGTVTPLLRIAVYAAVFMALSRYGVNKRHIYFMVLLYALVNITGGLVQGQTRLVGLDIGDPAQLGAVILAALVPILAGDMKFRGQWLVVVALFGGIWMTQTRGIWFATIVVLAVWAQRRLSAGKVVALIMVLAVVGFQVVGRVTEALGLNPASRDYRAESIEEGIRSGLAQPIFGSGWATVDLVDAQGRPMVSDEFVVPYNLLINVFTSVGTLGVVLLLLWLVALLRLLTPSRGAPLLFVTAFLALSVTEMTLYAGSTLTVLFFIYAGIGVNDELMRRRTDVAESVVLELRGVAVRTDQSVPPRGVSHRTLASTTPAALFNVAVTLVPSLVPSMK